MKSYQTWSKLSWEYFSFSASKLALKTLPDNGNGHLNGTTFLFPHYSKSQKASVTMCVLKCLRTEKMHKQNLDHAGLFPTCVSHHSLWLAWGNEIYGNHSFLGCRRVNSIYKVRHRNKIYGEWLPFEARLKWPLEELQFLTLKAAVFDFLPQGGSRTSCNQQLPNIIISVCSIFFGLSIWLSSSLYSHYMLDYMIQPWAPVIPHHSANCQRPTPPLLGKRGHSVHDEIHPP